MKYRIRKRRSGVYTIEEKSKWCERWKLCLINQVKWPNDEFDYEHIKHTWPHCAPFVSEPVFADKTKLDYLENIIYKLNESGVLGLVLLINKSTKDLIICDPDTIVDVTTNHCTQYKIIYDETHTI